MPSGYANGRGSALTHSQREQLFKHQAAIAELLRHFWACFPVLSPQLEEKVNSLSRSSFIALVLVALVLCGFESGERSRKASHLRLTQSLNLVGLSLIYTTSH